MNIKEFTENKEISINCCIQKIKNAGNIKLIKLRTDRYIIQGTCKDVSEVCEGMYVTVTGTVRTEPRADYGFEIEKIVLLDSAGIPVKKKLSKRIRIRTYKILKGVVTFAPFKKLFPDALDKLKKKFGSADYAAASDIMRYGSKISKECGTAVPAVPCAKADYSVGKSVFHRTYERKYGYF